MKLFPPFLLAVMLMPVFSTVQGEVLLLDAINNTPMNGSEGFTRPSRGQSMNRVQELFGEPTTIYPWVGDPPITRWAYDRFTVYFEEQYVINSVINR